MPSYSERSKKRLDTCHEDIRLVFNEVIKHKDCTILCGRRGEKAQNTMYDNGLSQVKYPNSKHNKEEPELSEAIDVTPYPIDWGNTQRHYAFAFFVLGVAAAKGVKLRCGADWDNDMDLSDQEFFDLNHFELTQEE